MDGKKSFREAMSMFCHIWTEFINTSNYAQVEFEKLPILHKVMEIFCSDEKLAKIMFENLERQFSNKRLNDVDWKAVREFFDCAKRDLKIAKLSHCMGYYDIAAYHTQQSVEKLSKYWLMRYNGYTYYQITQGIKHKTLLGYIQWLSNVLKVFMDSIEKIAKEMQISEKDKKFLEDVKKWRKETDKVRNKITTKEAKVEIFNASSYEIIKHLELIDVINKEFLERYRKFTEEFYNSGFIKFIFSEFDEQINNEDISQLMEYVKASYDLLMKTLYLYILGAYTHVHETPSRYYDNQIKKGPSDYKENLGIVVAFPEIFKRIESVISSYERIEKMKDKIWELFEKEEGKNARMGRV